ncbi:hypothetical protein A4X06_0g7456 [Tilletia controversa]|uniref:FAD-binding PCMH-type domain-containing protein n=1 Tax=Tilletia controversa TaxID=13291 RepID=A0A8X7SU73_9BASI|nr:hypothetical protein A4X06_0g7456 [Tilletia controversa]
MRVISALLGGIAFSSLAAVTYAVTAAPPLAGPGAPSANASTDEISQACSTLAKQLGEDKVHRQGILDYEYRQSVERSWNLQQSFYKPVCIVFPEETNDVVVAYQTIIENGLPYGVRSGSHGVAYGWCSTPGIFIDLQRMNKVEYDAKRGVAQLGPGNRWSRVYDILGEQNQTVIGGRVSDVGMGLMLNGGVSYISGEYGFASTNFVEVGLHSNRDGLYYCTDIYL